MAVHSNVFVLVVRQQVVFPQIRSSVNVQQDVFSELCDFCERHDSTHVAVITADPDAKAGDEELYGVGTYCRIVSHSRNVTKVGGKEVTVATLSIEGQSRFRVCSFEQTSPFRLATIELLPESPEAGNPAVSALVQSVQKSVVELLNAAPSSSAGRSQEKQSSAPTTSLKNIFGGGGKQRIRWPTSSSLIADMIGAGLPQLTVAERQRILATVDLQERLELVLELLHRASEVQRVSQEISSKLRKRREDELRETVLRRQLQELNKEMRRLKSGKSSTGTSADGEEASSQEPEGEPDEEQEEDEDDITALREALKQAKMPPAAMKIAQRELRRLQNIQPHHPEYTVCRTYLETMSGLPWAKSSEDDIDLPAARDILERDHYGLEKVKRRILEFLAVQKMRGDMRGPILCLHGPPGVGKTSLGRSIAASLGRKFHRIALGGVRDEAELRGHRRTYIGSMPGAIIQALQTLKVNNPVILLDEIDKLTRSAMFNPSGAMLELLDPEQNCTFKDHYLNTPFDLSRVLFLCTCNDLQTIDRPLLDRMEVIDLSGYTVEEKVHIATTHLLPKQRRLHALEGFPAAAGAEGAETPASGAAAEGAPAQQEATLGAAEPPASPPPPPRLELTQAAITDVISKWTMESGVRSLERRLAQVCRWAALRLAGAPSGASEEEESAAARAARAQEALAACGPNAEGCLRVDACHLPHIIGVELFEPDLAERLTVGVAMGLGVTPTGGQLLFVEATRNKGSRRLTITGQLGEVMRESVTTAMSLLRSKLYNAALLAGGSVGTSSGSSSRAAASAEAATPRAASKSPARSGANAGSGVAVGGGIAEVPGFQDVLNRLLEKADGIKDPFASDDIHVHFPAGGIPKDGPSAGVTIVLALASLLLGRPVRSDTAVTGEITLRGHVLPVGGIRDKVLAAHRAGLKHVLLPLANQRQAVDNLPPSALGDIELHYVRHIDEALAWAFPPLPSSPATSPQPPDGLADGLAGRQTSPGLAARPPTQWQRDAPRARL
eukprot:TRINITY_DN11789_c0_g1_i1.p1 TRINITY_DN11789_c0_g1~~TRINITY_DN11789_c0_g1_i1.p1  ORF type:complete len:1036 (-),score=279.04 TRINITY_DN11789_c0_g1_i1:100-3132(-)